MPIITSIPLQKYTQSEFGRIAYEVVGHAITVHGTLGRLLNESDYRSSVAALLGSRAIEELSICLLHGGYQKEVFVDLVVDCGCPFELKVVSALTSVHQCQLIQYLMLAELKHGKLINFGTEQLEQQFVNCHESLQQRQRFEVVTIDWPDDVDANHLMQVVVSLVRDWGTGLSKSLYHEAIVALLGGEQQCLQTTETYWNGHRVGRRQVYMINGCTAFEISCSRECTENTHAHLAKLVRNTSLDRLLWVNILPGCVQFQGIK